MPNTVFFSWQADRPTKEGRNLVERALERAVGQLGDDTTIEEAVRELEVDRDTKGVAGSPPIVETIFQKIDAAAVFVPDLTFVGVRPDGRPSPNPNVLIEYGWALKSLGHGQIVPIMNTAFGQPTAEAMPFDMRHLRNPIQYNCPIGANEEARKQARDTLAKALEHAIGDVLRSDQFKLKRSETLPPPSPFAGRDPMDGLGKFRSIGEPLGVSERFLEAARAIKITKGPVVWMRLMPMSDPGRVWQVSELKKNATDRQLVHPVLSAWQGFDFMRAEDGFGIYAPLHDEKDMTSAVVFFFKTGEVWSIDSYILNAMREHGSNAIPLLEEDFQRALTEYTDFLLRLEIPPPFRWIIGMENLKGRGIVDSTGRLAGFRGPRGHCVADVIAEEGTHSPDNLPAASIEPFFVKLFDSCGLERPRHQNAR